MMRSLAFKWVATLVLTSLVGVALVGVFAYRATITEFDRLRSQQAEDAFIEDMALYYRLNGSWQGIEDLRRQGNPPRMGRGGSPTEMFALVDPSGLVIFGHGAYTTGGSVPSGVLSAGTPILVDGVQVGTVLTTQPPPELDPREQRYIDGTNRALLVGALGAGAAALLVGVLLSRGFLRQLAELTRAMAAIRGGDLAQQVAVYSQDELGSLAQAFNQMSADLHRASYLRQQMTADIAHELRTPLTVISGYAEGLADGTLKPTPERFEAINTEVTLLKRLVEDLRTLSLADAGELRLNLQPVQPAEMVAQVGASFQPLAQVGQVELRVELGSGLPVLLIDRERMLQVLANLTSNALQHTPAGGVVTLLARRAPEGVQWVVRDSGSGIAPEHLPHIFERFYRADAARTGVLGESGLGLAIVKSIVDAHGGKIAVESAPGAGTTMTITLHPRPDTA
jgi:signal transduction histidine kinase